MEGVPGIVKTIMDVGIMVVLSAIVVYASIKVIDLVILYFKNKVDAKTENKEKSERLEARGQASDHIQKLIQDTLNIYKYRRLQIIEFSNTVKSIANLPFKYMSCTYEVVPLGIKSAGYKIDRISTSLFTSFFSKLTDAQYIVADRNDEVDAHFVDAIAELIDGSPDYNYMFDMMLTVKGKAIGYIMIVKESEFTEEDKNNIQMLSNKVSALLSVLDD